LPVRRIRGLATGDALATDPERANSTPHATPIFLTKAAIIVKKRIRGEKARKRKADRRKKRRRRKKEEE
jgi:hypothetical protein